MPSKFLMSWDPKPRCWWRQYKKKRYKVSCRQLSAWVGKPVLETKEGSYLVANEWWRAKQAKIDGYRPPNPHEEEITELRRRRDLCRQRGENEQAEHWDRLATALEDHPEAPSVLGYYQDLAYRLIEYQQEQGKTLREVPPELLKLTVEDRVWEERHQREGTTAVPEDATIGGQIARWLERQQARVAAGSLTAGAFDNVRRCLHEFRDWMGSQLAVTTLNEERIEAYHLRCLGKVGERERDPNRKAGWSRDYASKAFGIVRTFVRYLWEKSLIELPKNLDSRDLRFGVSAKPIITMTDEEVRLLVEHASGQLKLHLLLMLNCGMYQSDISDLKQSEVDWEQGRITRKRSKTRDQAGVPTVSYKLWPLTFTLLKEHAQGGEDAIVLRTRSGGQWAWEELTPEGKLRSSDNIATLYNRLRKSLGIAKTLKVFRKTSATKLRSNPHYGHLDVHFLGHSPRTIAARHYSAESEDLFDEAIAWLGRQYGFIVE